jgi:hypothetical protein
MQPTVPPAFDKLVRIRGHGEHARFPSSRNSYQRPVNASSGLRQCFCQDFVNTARIVSAPSGRAAAMTER